MELSREKLTRELLSLSDRELNSLSLHLYDTIASTNQMLWELIDNNYHLPLVAIATQQTAGRGQWGRHWQSPPGGLYLSVALKLDLAPSNAFHIIVFTACGITEALRRHDLPIYLKWPNDLILQKRKLGGIKSETRIQGDKITRAVIGIGINWLNPVPAVGINLESFTDKIDSLEKLAAIAITGIYSGYQAYLGKGIKSLLPSYLTFVQSIGQKVMVDGCPGVVIGVSDRGELQVKLQSSGATTTINLSSGTISLGYDQ
jgi:BirA family transcriptional regulator, biotin operon repressor / biotin---[acetyl-CoA-carboxylase] ligase